eukprot:scaffold255757_cov15-Tisochrysis_lutea.AAC.1
MPQHCAGWSTAGTLWRIMPWGVAGANQTSAGGVTMQPFLDARSIMANVSECCLWHMEVSLLLRIEGPPESRQPVPIMAA